MISESVLNLQQKVKQFAEAGRKHGVTWSDAAIATPYRGDARQFAELIRNGDELSHETVKGVLRTWGRLIKEKQLEVASERGVSPKVTVPTKTMKLVEESASEVVGLTEAEALESLNAHNEHRRKYGAADLVYDARLATKAQAWANHLARRLVAGHGMEHCSVRTVEGLEGNTGENLAMAGGSGYVPGAYKPNHAKPVKDWVDEVKDYDLVKKEPKPRAGATGHFTQVVWKGTTRVGCGFALVYYGQKQFAAVWVSNYHPAGNVVGHHAKNVG